MTKSCSLGEKAYLELHNADQVFGSLSTVVTLTGLTVLTLLHKEVEALTKPRVALPCNGQMCCHLGLQYHLHCQMSDNSQTHGVPAGETTLHQQFCIAVKSCQQHHASQQRATQLGALMHFEACCR